jgi:NADH:ubiquinone oxidoreductase subunit H
MTPLLIAQLALTLLVFVALLSSAAGMVYFERKVAAWLQQRVGPTRWLVRAASSSRSRT